MLSKNRLKVKVKKGKTINNILNKLISILNNKIYKLKIYKKRKKYIKDRFKVFKEIKICI